MPLIPPNIVRTPEGYRPSQAGGPSGPCCVPLGFEFFVLITPELPSPLIPVFPCWNLAATDTIQLVADPLNGPGSPIVTINGPIVIVPSNGLTPGTATVPLQIVPDVGQQFPASYRFLALNTCGCAGIIGDLVLLPNGGGGSVIGS